VTRSERGSAVVDFVLVSMVVVPLFLGLLQLGLFLYVRNMMTAAASDGARHAATADRGPEDGVARTEERIGRAVSSRLVDSVRFEETEIDGQPAVAIVVDAHLPALGLWGPSVDFTVRGHGIEEQP
jgi:Flp pilus assembly protein TadG